MLTYAVIRCLVEIAEIAFDLSVIDTNFGKALEHATTLPNGTKILVASPHPVNFYDEKSEDNKFVVPGGTLVVSARPVEVVVRTEGNVEYITTKFVGDPATEWRLRRILDQIPGLVIVGSNIAAQAYPGLVCGLVPMKGFERRPPAEKRMDPNRFNVYG